jgi:hypothetical protein
LESADDLSVVALIEGGPAEVFEGVPVSVPTRAQGERELGIALGHAPHEYPPGVLVQADNASQPPLADAHSSTSTQKVSPLPV